MVATTPKSTALYCNRPRLTVPISGKRLSMPKNAATALAFSLSQSIFLVISLIMNSIVDTNALAIPQKIFCVTLPSCTKLYRAFFAPAFAAALIKSKVLAATCSIPTKPPWLVAKKLENAPVLPFVVSPTLASILSAKAETISQAIENPSPIKPMKSFAMSVVTPKASDKLSSAPVTPCVLTTTDASTAPMAMMG
ncbi:hypothetical protein AO367_1704 [Moraxella catarrhalis]|nr:hypothetical protein AO367_1704 [Moraxella catarrhalis]